MRKSDLLHEGARYVVRKRRMGACLPNMLKDVGARTLLSFCFSGCSTTTCRVTATNWKLREQSRGLVAYIKAAVVASSTIVRRSRTQCLSNVLAAGLHNVSSRRSNEAPLPERPHKLDTRSRARAEAASDRVQGIRRARDLECIRHGHGVRPPFWTQFSVP
ncbi:hypothetical protein BC834DRAFT_496743 [Gloeopeniophorella convolvens]|nr:hypothetical protein BC834DRAFT_496743 [Gloeopeniophorella convolvens]